MTRKPTHQPHACSNKQTNQLTLKTTSKTTNKRWYRGVFRKMAKKYSIEEVIDNSLNIKTLKQVIQSGQLINGEIYDWISVSVHKLLEVMKTSLPRAWSKLLHSWQMVCTAMVSGSCFASVSGNISERSAALVANAPYAIKGKGFHIVTIMFKKGQRIPPILNSQSNISGLF